MPSLTAGAVQQRPALVDLEAKPMSADASKPYGGTDKDKDRQLLGEFPHKDPVVEILVQTAYRAAGCHVCDRPIPKGDTRLAVVVHLPEPRLNKRTGKSHSTERYYLHASCITAALDGRNVRSAYGCWDCGIAMMKGRGDPCWTTGSHSFGRLCERCAELPRWAQCHHCSVQFPHWMVSFSRDGSQFCDSCAMRTGTDTRRVVEARKSQFQELRNKILDDGLFSE